TPDYELQAGQMKLGYDEDSTALLLSIVGLEIVLDSNEEPQVVMKEDDAISFLFSLEDARELSAAIIAVVNAGRPVCPLCHAPLDGGPHACVRQNGHRDILQVETSDDEDEEE
ncbi:MAG TPA: DUF3090 family protein, partial [Ktedonobacteraceae bacterium]|nr:DUF3090 family protein [Ktedonobacteraceae bacterium]